MQHLTSYQHAHDAGYERAINREDAIDREADAIIADKVRLMEVIEAMLVDTEIPLVELLAFSYASDCAPRPGWTYEFRHSSIIKDTNTAIYEAVMKESRCLVDAREEV